MSTARSCILKCPAEEGTIYFEFPDENKQNDQRNDWIDILQINPAKDVQAYLCERHFSQRQRTQMGLKSSAVPDINLSFSPEFYEMEEPFTDCDSQMPETLCTNFIDEKVINTNESPTRYSVIDGNDLAEEQNPQRDQTKSFGKVSSYYEAFLRNINEGIRESCAPTKIPTASNQIKGPLKLCTIDAHGNYIPVTLKKFKICSQSTVDKTETLPNASHKNTDPVKEIQTSSLNIINKSLPTIQNKQPKLFSVLKEPDTKPEETSHIFKDSETPTPSTNNSIKLLESNFRIANTIISINNAKKLDNNVPAVLENREVLPHLRNRTPSIEEGTNAPKKMCTPNSKKVDNFYESVPTKSRYLSSVSTITTPLPSDTNSSKDNKTNDDLTRAKRSLYMSRVNNIIGSKITVTLKSKSPSEKNSLFRRISTEFDSDGAPNVSENSNIKKPRGRHNATTSIIKDPKAISYRCQFPLNVTLQDLSKQPTVINVIDDSTDDELEFLGENSLPDSTYSRLQTSSVLGDTDAEDEFFNEFMKPRKPRKKPKRIVGRRAKMNRLKQARRISARETLREHNFSNIKTIDSKGVLINTGRKTPPGLFSVLKEPSEIGNRSRRENVQRNKSYLITKGKSIFRTSSPIMIPDHQYGDERNPKILQSTAIADESHRTNNSQSVNTSAEALNSDREITNLLESKVESIYSRYDNVPFTIDESMMVISRGVQASGDYRYRSPSRIRLEEDVNYLRRTLEEGSEALNTLKITTKNALEILEENDERITNTICAKLPREVAKMVRESLSKKIPYP